jgi:hypothetical protein
MRPRLEQQARHACRPCPQQTTKKSECIEYMAGNMQEEGVVDSSPRQVIAPRGVRGVRGAISWAWTSQERERPASADGEARHGWGLAGNDLLEARHLPLLLPPPHIFQASPTSLATHGCPQWQRRGGARRQGASTSGASAARNTRVKRGAGGATGRRGLEVSIESPRAA